MKTTIPSFCIVLAFLSVTLAPKARAVVPAPDGGYPNGNTAEGDNALFNLDTSQGANNTAIGFSTLFSNTLGDNNTANGTLALFLNTTGNGNTASGVEALYSNTTGSANTATGFFALFSNTTGNSNIALGTAAGQNLTTGSNNIDIGNAGARGESNKIRIGTNGTHTNTFIAGISGVTVASGVGVIIDALGHLGTVVSSARFKEAIKPMDTASEAILALKPVTFRYKKELDRDSIPQFGLVAEEVEKVNPDLVARDELGKPYSVRYDAVNAMLLNEFLKAHRTMEEQGATIADLKAEIATLSATVREQSAQIQKVSAQLEISKPASQTIANNQ
jgi:endosialidase-like protein